MLQDKIVELEGIHKATMSWLSDSKAECMTLQHTVNTLEHEVEMMRREICSDVIDQMIETIENVR